MLAKCLAARGLCGIDFKYSIVDSGTGRELQNQPIHNIAGLGESTGDRPFRPFAKPMLFLPRSTIRIEVEEISEGPLYGTSRRSARWRRALHRAARLQDARLRDRDAMNVGHAATSRGTPATSTSAGPAAFPRTPTTSTSPASSRRRRSARRWSWPATSFIPSTAAPCSTSLSTRSRPAPGRRRRHDARLPVADPLQQPAARPVSADGADPESVGTERVSRPPPAGGGVHREVRGSRGVAPADTCSGTWAGVWWGATGTTWPTAGRPTACSETPAMTVGR